MERQRKKPQPTEVAPPEKYYMTRRTYQRLVEEIARRVEAVNATLRESGEASSGGDKWHDEHVKNLIDKEIGERRRLWEARLAQNQAVIISAPPQTERVTLGHRIAVIFLYGEGETEEAHVTILGELDVILKDPHFNQKDEMVVSYKSPLGKALLGATEGQVVSYKVKDKSFLIAVEDIGVARLVAEET